MLPEERFLSLGIPTRSTAEETGADWLPGFQVDKLSASEAMHLTGNAIHLPVLHALLLYMMANVERRAMHERVPASLSSVPSAEEMEPRRPQAAASSSAPSTNDDDADAEEPQPRRPRAVAQACREA